MSHSTAEAWISQLQLAPHPEGGWFREVYRSTESVQQAHLPERFGGDRCFSTAIYFLLQGTEFSALHRISQDELWHFYDGTALTIHVIDTHSQFSQIKLGRDTEGGESPMGVVSAGSWFGATVDSPGSFALVGCTVAPGFDFADVEMPNRSALIERYPQHCEWIERLTRN